jgi:hypothetical protein
VEITISLNQTNPPVGTVTWRGNADAEAFTGWLGLLAVLSALLDRLPFGPGGSERDPRAKSELPEDVRDMALDCAPGQEQPLGDRRIRKALDNEGCHPLLGPGEGGPASG